MFRTLFAAAFATASLAVAVAPSIAATPVSAAGLDLATSAGVAAFDARLVRAARAECAPDNTYDLHQVIAARACTTSALNAARAKASTVVAEARASHQVAMEGGR